MDLKTRKPSKASASDGRTKPLVVSLAHPGMTPLLCAGVGGLAASLRAIAKGANIKWPAEGSCQVPLGPGSASVTRRHITIDWGDSVERTMGALIGGSFGISEGGLIDLPGTRTTVPSLPLQAALQDALKRTFLQHGKSTTKKGGLRRATIEIDDRPVPVNYQAYSSFVHMTEAVGSIRRALTNGTVDLPGWAYPGAAVRHTGHGSATSLEYSAELALAAFFAIVGSLSLLGPGRTGVLVILRPHDLLRFARARERLTPATVAAATVGGASDAVLTTRVALLTRAAEVADGVGEVDAVLLRATAWDKKQKYRVGTVDGSSVSEAAVRAFERAMKLWPTQLVALKEKKGLSTGYFSSPSLLREFVASNLASGRRWFLGFATARPDGERYLHYLRRSDNKGALMGRERDGLDVMLESLEEAEKILIRSVHVAIRQRFGAIAEETDGDNARKKRWENERERWRLAFAQAKTHEQVRGALADLWSRAGANRELKANWERVLPLLRADSWHTTRDLALVALASYRGAGPDLDPAGEPEPTDSTNNE